MKLFASTRFSILADEKLEALRLEIINLPTETVLDTDFETLVLELMNKYQFHQVSVDTEDIEMTEDQKIPPGKHANTPQHCITFYFKVEGDPNLLRFVPSTYSLKTYLAELEGNVISIDVFDGGGDIRPELDQIEAFLTTNTERLSKDIDEYNAEVERRARQTLEGRKARTQGQIEKLAATGVRLRRNPNIPGVLSRPLKVEEAKASREVKDSAKAYSLEKKSGNDILRVIEEAGRAMERYPSTHVGKREEDIRDHFLVVLGTHYQNATGETFSVVGKTDILVRYGAGTVFIAECKFWGGEKLLLKAIDQALGYLTWRDTQAALLIFVCDTDLTTVDSVITSVVPSHPSFVSSGNMENGRYAFKFSLPTHPDRHVDVEIFTFSFPNHKRQAEGQKKGRKAESKPQKTRAKRKS